ncbi:MAG: O-antigen ligase family protein [Isosphaeraceae bacterium]
MRGQAQSHRHELPHDGPPERRAWAVRAADAVILAVALLSPWAFGAVEAWAEWLIASGIALAAGFVAIAGGQGGIRCRLACGPGLAIAGLAVLGLAQSDPLPHGLFDRIAPAAAADRAALLPHQPETVIGDPEPAVKIPRPTLSLLPEATRHEAIRLAGLWVLFQCVLGLGGGFAALRRFGRATAINAAIVAAFSLVQALTWTGGIYWSRPSPIVDGWNTGGPFIGHGALAAYLNLGLGLALANLLTTASAARRRPGPTVLAALPVLVLLAGLIASQSRSGFVGMAAAGILLSVVAGRRVATRAVAVAALAVPAALALWIAVDSSAASRRVVSIGDAGSLADRLEIWGASLRAGAHHRLLGSGLGSFAVAVAAETPTDYGVVFARAENEYLDILLEGGVVGLAIVAAGLVALVRRGLRSLAAATDPRDRTLIAGALFSLTALAVQAAGDFSPHIPAVAVTAVILAAHICSLRASEATPPALLRRAWVVRNLEPAAVALLALALLPHGLARARAEACLAGTRLPPPGSSYPALVPRDESDADLLAMIDGLEAALVDRPDWAEGHLRLGLALIARYEHTAIDRMAGATGDSELAAVMGDPLWLHARAHSDLPIAEIADQEPVRAWLVPAARSFLEARRCAPTMAAAHAHLAALDYLLGPRSTGPAHAARALRQAGGDQATLALAARAAFQSGDAALAARLWHRALQVRPWDWEDPALAAAASLSPAEVLADVLPAGAGWPAAVAELAYSGSDDADTRAAFLRASLERLPADTTLSPGERLHLEGLAHAGLGQPELAAPLFDAALRREPLRDEWREELVVWLLDRGDLDAAHRHAVLGVRLNPERFAIRKALEKIDAALARGERSH